MLRRAAWSDQFYPGHPRELARDLERFLAAGPAEKILSPVGCLAPHAGYMYSGAVAGAVYARLDLPDRFIILCPNHMGLGQPLSIMSEGAWQTPLGNAPIDSDLAGELRRRCPLLTEDAEAHRQEHSIEVQLPFLQKLQPAMRFVPVAVGTESFDALERLARAIAGTIRASGRRVLIVASSDMNHYDNDERTRIKDRRAIDQLLALHPRGLYDTVRREGISMCGYCPAVAMMTAALELGAARAELVRYATSADACGDHSRVVGYAGIVLW